MLKRVRKNGAYLVRRKETEQGTDGSDFNGDVFDTQDDKSSYAISFRLVQSLPFPLVLLKQ